MLYNTYRPTDFSEVKGQEDVLLTLKRQSQTGNFGHAYLLAGHRGSGKTTIARILSKAVNCQNPSENRPCKICASCLAAKESLDILELDAASNNGVDKIKEMMAQTRYQPVQLHKKVFIIDEVHNLSTAAFDVLLKPLEEPPAYCTFILCTTELHKIPVTVRSRCEEYVFHPIGAAPMKERLKEVLKDQNAVCDEDALNLIVRNANSGLRDALGLLEQLIVSSDGNITSDIAKKRLGVLDTDQILDTLEYIIERNPLKVLTALDGLLQNGKSPSLIVETTLNSLTDMITMKSTQSKESVMHSQEYLERLWKLTAHISFERLYWMCEQYCQLRSIMRNRVDFKTLEQYHEGLIALSACLAGEVPKKLQQGNYKAACETAIRYKTLFGPNNYYLELQAHGIPEQKTVNKQLVKMSQELNIPLLATNDVHYTKKEDVKAHDVLLCIQTKKKVTDSDRLRYEGEQYYVKSVEEMQTLFPEYEEALENTEKIANRCQVELVFNHYHLPEFKEPNALSSWDYLNKLCENGLRKRYPQNYGKHHPQLIYELNTIREMGFVDYFLIVWDFINYAKSNDIPVGPGRGSAAGSIVSYCLGITEIDPTKYELLFERFLKPQCITMPDIDVDFCYERRQEVIQYVIEKYGKNNVAQIVTFGTLAAKGVIRDVGKALNITSSIISKITKLIPNDSKVTIADAIASVGELKKLYDNDVVIRNLLDMASKLEGLPRHTSTHAAGIVICPKPVTEYVLVCLSTEGNI